MKGSSFKKGKAVKQALKRKLLKGRNLSHNGWKDRTYVVTKVHVEKREAGCYLN